MLYQPKKMWFLLKATVLGKQRESSYSNTFVVTLNMLLDLEILLLKL